MKKLISIFTLAITIVLSVIVVNPIKAEAAEIMTAQEFADKCYEVATEYKTLYVMGCFGAPMNSTNKNRYINEHSYNQGADRTKKINAASSDTFGFDCVCLIKGILWGWSGNTGKTYGGATYASNGVSDMSIPTMKSKCTGVTTDFSNIEVGEILFHKDSSGTYDHVGIYIGNGLAVESTPIWDDGVQVTAVSNIGSKNGYNSRKWYSHGKLTPFLKYGPTHKCSEFNNLGVCKECSTSFDWASTLNKSDSGIYKVTKDFTARTNAPYEAATAAASSIKKDSKVTVIGSYTNAFGNKWYKFNYNGTEGYVFNSYLIYESSDKTPAGEYSFLFPVNNGGVNIAFLYGSTPEYSNGSQHDGIDIYSNGDQVIYAAFSGTVTKINNSCNHVHYPKENNGSKCAHYSTWGNSVYIKSDDGKIYGIYGHLKQNSILVKNGDKIEKGQPLASMGSSGHSYNKHLHFEVRKSDFSTKINVNPSDSSRNTGVVDYTTSGYQQLKSDTISEGTYALNNDGYRMYMKRNASDFDTLGASNSAVTSKFEFNIIKDGNFYRLVPKDGGANYLNSVWNDTQVTHSLNGAEVTLCKNDAKDYSQKWIFEECGNGYLIHPACTPAFSITRDGNKLVVKQTTKEANQIWKLEGDCNHQYVYKKDEATEDLGHWKECTLCEDKTEMLAHNYDCKICDTSCDDCGYTKAMHSETILTEFKHTYVDSWGHIRECKHCGSSEEEMHHPDMRYYYNASQHYFYCRYCESNFEYKDHTFSNQCDTTCDSCRYQRTTSHEYTNDCDNSCNVCGATRTTSHKYTNNCDTTCNVCNEARTVTHAYGEWSVVDPATCTEKGSEKRTCSVCGKAEERELEKTEHSLDTRTDGKNTFEYCKNCSYFAIVGGNGAIGGSNSNGNLSPNGTLDVPGDNLLSGGNNIGNSDENGEDGDFSHKEYREKTIIIGASVIIGMTFMGIVSGLIRRGGKSKASKKEK